MEDNKYQAIMLGDHTYGYLNLNSNIFRCTHGGWEAELTFLPGNQCKLQGVGIFSYQYLDKIPEDYNYA